MKDLRNIHVLEAMLFAFAHNASFSATHHEQGRRLSHQSTCERHTRQAQDVRSCLCSGSHRKFETTQMFVGQSRFCQCKHCFKKDGGPPFLLVNKNLKSTWRVSTSTSSLTRYCFLVKDHSVVLTGSRETEQRRFLRIATISTLWEFRGSQRNARGMSAQETTQ